MTGETTDANHRCPECSETFDAFVARDGRQGCCPHCGSPVRGQTRDVDQDSLDPFMADGGDSESDDATCDYCDSSTLVYELKSDRGLVERCIPCLAIEQGQQAMQIPIDDAEASDIFDNDSICRRYTRGRDWFTVLARLSDDKPLVKRDDDELETLDESTRNFLTNIMGGDAYHPPSEVVGSEVSVAQQTLGELGGDAE